MGAFDSVVKRVQPQMSKLRIVPADINAAYVSLAGGEINIWDMRAGKLGSTNGSTYGTAGQIAIFMAESRWQNLWLGFHWTTPNVATTITMYSAYTVSANPANDQDVRAQLLSVTLPVSTNYFRFDISDGWGDIGGVVGGATVNNGAHYRVSPGLACPLVLLSFDAGSAPTSGVLSFLEIVRTT